MAGHVYLIGSHKFHWYKIGKSADARIRIVDLGILLPFKVEIVVVWKMENHHEVERLLHEKYALHQINGEWFSFSINRINDILFEMRSSQVTAITNFSNIDADVVPRGIRKAMERDLGRNVFPAAKNRIGELTAKSHKLEEQVLKLTRENAELRAKVSVPTL